MINNQMINSTEQIVIEAINDINKTLPKEKQIGNSLETSLIDRNDSFDSITFVEFFLTIEKKLQEQKKIEIEIINENFFKKNKSPFLNVRNLIQYIDNLINNNE